MISSFFYFRFYSVITLPGPSPWIFLLRIKLGKESLSFLIISLTLKYPSPRIFLRSIISTVFRKSNWVLVTLYQRSLLDRTELTKREFSISLPPQNDISQKGFHPTLKCLSQIIVLIIAAPWISDFASKVHKLFLARYQNVPRYIKANKLLN